MDKIRLMVVGVGFLMLILTVYDLVVNSLIPRETTASSVNHLVALGSDDSAIHDYLSVNAERLQHQLVLSESCTISIRSQFQQSQVDKYCSSEVMTRDIPLDVTQQHFLFNDTRKDLFCLGSANMKDMMFVSVEKSADQESEDLIIGISHTFLNSNITQQDRKQHLKDYYKFTFVQNPLERLASSYQNNIQNGISEFSIFIRQKILEMYRPIVYHQWLQEGRDYNISISFSEFIEYYINSFKGQLHPYFKPFTATCHPCKVRYHFYGNLANYGRDVMMILNEVNTNNNSPHRHFYSSVNATTSSKYYSDLTLLQKARLYDCLREELLFYYHLYPRDRYSHVRLLGIPDNLYPLS